MLQAVSVGSVSGTQRQMPRMPALSIAPESTALAGAGASGWASGSQTCSGQKPAFRPRPSSSRARVR